MLEGMCFYIHRTQDLTARMPWLFGRIPPGCRGVARRGPRPSPLVSSQGDLVHEALGDGSVYLYKLELELNVHIRGCIFEGRMRLQILFNASLLIVPSSWAQFIWAGHDFAKGEEGGRCNKPSIKTPGRQTCQNSESRFSLASWFREPQVFARLVDQCSDAAKHQVPTADTAARWIQCQKYLHRTPTIL